MAESHREEPDSDEAERRRLAGIIFHAQLAGRTLPHGFDAMPDDLLVDRLARMDAKEVLATLQEIYDLDWWDKEAFERIFVRGALEGWKPGTLVQRSPAGLRIVSTTCPVASEVERDPRICDMCQALQKHAAYLAMMGQVQDVSVDRLMSKGESTCEINISYRPHARVPDERAPLSQRAVAQGQ